MKISAGTNEYTTPSGDRVVHEMVPLDIPVCAVAAHHDEDSFYELFGAIAEGKELNPGQLQTTLDWAGATALEMMQLAKDPLSRFGYKVAVPTQELPVRIMSVTEGPTATPSCPQLSTTELEWAPQGAAVQRSDDGAIRVTTYAAKFDMDGFELPQEVWLLVSTTNDDIKAFLKSLAYNRYVFDVDRGVRTFPTAHESVAFNL